MKFLIKMLLMLLIFGMILEAKDVATVTGLNGQAFVQRDGTKIELNQGDKLQVKDTVITDAKAKVQIIFEDETIVTVGKNSNFSVDEYLFEEGKEVVARFGMLKGAMRTITGSIGKLSPDKFSVVTKTAVIGIRGTNFSVVVGADDSHIVYCTYGAINVDFKGLEYVVQQGYYIGISPDGIAKIKEFTPKDLKEMKEKNFGKSIAKEGQASNESLLDNTKDDYSNLVVHSTTALVEDANYNIPVQEYIIAGYTMHDATYLGSYTTASNTIVNFNNTGAAELTVNFSLDEAYLVLSGGGHDATYNQNPSGFNTNSFSIGLDTSDGSLDGSTSGGFYGSEGEIVNGTFNYRRAVGFEAVGSYNVNAVQPLY